MKTKSEIREIIMEKKFWKRYEKPFGWTLIGWTYRYRASFGRKDGSTVEVGGPLNISTAELDKILKG